jgi:hypothetical protein
MYSYGTFCAFYILCRSEGSLQRHLIEAHQAVHPGMANRAPLGQVLLCLGTDTHIHKHTSAHTHIHVRTHTQTYAHT